MEWINLFITSTYLISRWEKNQLRPSGDLQFRAGFLRSRIKMFELIYETDAIYADKRNTT